MTTLPTTAVTGSELTVGDVIAFLGATYRIDRLEPASPATKAVAGDDARFAYAGDWAITVAAGQQYRILPRPAAAA